MNAVPLTLQDAFAAPLLDPALPCPPELRAWNGSDPARRFAVYRNNVVSGLVDALAETFPVTQALVGEEFFRAMASVFVRRHPPRSPLLVFYGDALPGFIREFEPARPVPYLADVACLEMARVHAYHAPDAQPMPADVAARELARLARDAETASRIVLRLHPSVAALASRHAAVAIWAAHQADHAEDIEAGLAAIDTAIAQDALLLRPGLEVLVVALPPGCARFIGQASEGRPLGEAAQRTGQEHVGFDAAPALHALVAHGAVTGIELPESDSH